MRTQQESLMNTRFTKLALATSVAAGLAGVSQTSYAIVEAVGEGLLIPLVVWEDVAPAGQSAGDVNTIIDVTIPGAIGFEDVANIFTAPHTTPTNPGNTLFPPDEDLEDGNQIHWYWFNNRSLHLLNRAVDVTADDMVQINWRTAAGGAFNGVAGYMVIGTETARSGAAADFDMFGDAHLVVATSPTPLQNYTANIPVLPLTDGEDGPFNSPATSDDNIKYNGSGVPRAVSPLISGMRTSFSDGELSDFTVFDLTLSREPNATIHVVWLDQNQADPGDPYYVPVDVFDTEEFTCSSTISLPHELNVNWIGTAFAPLPPFNAAFPGIPGWLTNPETGTPNQQVCDPTTGIDAGFVRYQLPEYQDDGSLTAEAAGVSFSIRIDQVGPGGATPNVVTLSTSLGHDRGMFK
jgi:hypothetical protein